MSERHERLTLQLVDSIIRLFRDSGATQIEQYSALNVVRHLVPLLGSSLVEATEPSESQHERFT